MNETHKYRATDKMSDLICDNYSLLMVMSRFGLSLGFGDKTVRASRWASATRPSATSANRRAWTAPPSWP